MCRDSSVKQKTCKQNRKVAISGIWYGKIDAKYLIYSITLSL